MALDMKNFLTQYYMQLHMNNMPVEVRASFASAEKAGQLTKEMKVWRDGKPADALTGAPAIRPLIPQDTTVTPPVPDVKRWANTMLDNDLPDADVELTSEDWEKLFLAIQTALRSMSANKKDFADNDKAQKFLDQFFGDGKIFNVGSLSNETTTAAENLSAFLSFNGNEAGYRIYNALAAAGNTTFESSSDFNQFLSDLNSGKYKTDTKVRNKLERLAQLLSGNWDFFESKGVDFNRVPGLTQNEADQIANNLDEDNTIDPYKLSLFKREYGDILNALYKDNKVSDEFSKYDKNKISGPLKTAREKVNYDVKTGADGKTNDNYLAPKRDDELTLGQKISKWKADTFEDCLKKYATLRGDRLIFSDDTKLIIKAFDKVGKKPEEKIKPTDGLEGILNKVSGISEKLPPVARKKFEYFVSIMGELKNTMPKAFAKALQNGNSLKAIVSEMIMSAVRNNKVEECKVAMEILSIVKYGWVTSKVMDAMRKLPMNTFSDKGLSWNKNAGVQFVTTALDRSIKAAFIGIGYGVTITGNAIRLSGNKFAGQRGRMTQAQNEWDTKNTASRTNVATLRGQDDANRTLHRTTLDNLDTTYGINSGNIDAHETRKQDYEVAVQTYDDNEEGIAEGIAANGPLRAQIRALNTQIATLTGDIAALQALLNDPTTYTGLIPPAAATLADSISKQIQDKQQQLQNATQSRDSKVIEKNNLRTSVMAMIGNRAFLAADRDTKKTSYSGTSTPNSMDIKLNAWHEATEQVDFLDNVITKRDNELATWDDDHKDKYKELMAYWDFLESGRTKSWSPMRKSTKQKDFDKNKAAQMSAFQSGYSYAA